uniref:U9-Theraphotoxin-Sfo1a_1 n=1 Tax=Selenotholus foelschei TaxID=1905327 RepID=A0A482ZIB0_9ARAC
MFSLKVVLLVSILCLVAVMTIAAPPTGDTCRFIMCGMPLCPEGTKVTYDRSVSCCPFCS